MGGRYLVPQNSITHTNPTTIVPPTDMPSKNLNMLNIIKEFTKAVPMPDPTWTIIANMNVGLLPHLERDFIN